jgi:cytochrome b561
MRTNTAERWGNVQIGLHWGIAALVLLAQVPPGTSMVWAIQGSTASLS